jgi:ParB-like chromosome segregation protein Spo0J
VTAEFTGIRDIPLGQLTRFPGNARYGNVPAIRQSLKRNGQYRALIVRDTGNALVILAGNHTYDALRANGARTGRCEVLTCDDQTARRINLADNRTAELGGTDLDALAELLSYLDGDYLGTGYTESEVERLINPELPPSFGEYDETAAHGVAAPKATCPECGHTFNPRAIG